VIEREEFLGGVPHMEIVYPERRVNKMLPERIRLPGATGTCEEHEHDLESYDLFHATIHG
jgi:hypothetical protein